MTKEDKELLLKDLAARFPYGVVLDVDTTDWRAPQGHIQVKIEGYGIIFKDLSLIVNGSYYGDNYKPYLRPLTSITEEEEKEFNQIFEIELEALEDVNYGHTIKSAASSVFIIDFYNKHHFDYRGLIPKGLAIEVNESNNPYKD